jgi:hypothetical protein
VAVEPIDLKLRQNSFHSCPHLSKRWHGPLLPSTSDESRATRTNHVLPVLSTPLAPTPNRNGVHLCHVALHGSCRDLRIQNRHERPIALELHRALLYAVYARFSSKRR